MSRRSVRRSCSRRSRRQQQRRLALHEDGRRKLDFRWADEQRDIRSRREGERDLRVIVVAGLTRDGDRREQRVCLVCARDRELVGLMMLVLVLVPMIVLAIGPCFLERLVMRMPVRVGQAGSR